MGHAGPPLAQTSHNYEQLREKLRKKLEKRNPDKPKKEIKVGIFLILKIRKQRSLLKYNMIYKLWF